MEFKSFYAASKAVGEDTIEGLAGVMGNIDFGGDIVHRGAFKKTIKEGMGKVRHLWNHDATQPPIAKILELAEVGAADFPEDFREKHPEVKGGLMVVRQYLSTPRAQEVLEGIKTRAITEMSFGFDPVKFDYKQEGGSMVRNLRELNLWDTSDVNWGMNPYTIASKSVVGYNDTGTKSIDTPFTVPTLEDFTDIPFDQLSPAEKKRIAGHFTWAGSSDPEFTDLKFPHHLPENPEGIGPVCYHGLVQSMASLMGAPGSPIIMSPTDRRAIYNHLSRHYAEFGEEAPDWKLVELTYLATTIGLDEIKAGRVLSSNNLERLKSALQVLSELLLSAEPLDIEGSADPDPSLTEKVLQRMKIAEEELFLLSH